MSLGLRMDFVLKSEVFKFYPLLYIPLFSAFYIMGSLKLNGMEKAIKLNETNILFIRFTSLFANNPLFYGL